MHAPATRNTLNLAYLEFVGNIIADDRDGTVGIEFGSNSVTA